MGDLPEDTHVSSSPKNPEVVLTIGFLNDKVGKYLAFIVTLAPISTYRSPDLSPYISVKNY